MNNKPNILIVFPDQVRADWVEPLANVPVRTPNARRLADRGVAFSMAWTPSPICAPARACFATAKNYDRSPVKHNKQNVPPGSDTIYRRMADAGYAVSTIGKLDLLKGFMDWGADGQHLADGRSRLFDLGFNAGVDSAGKHDALWGRDRGAKEPYMTYLAGLGLDQVHYDDFRRRELPEAGRPIGETMHTSLPPAPAYGNIDLSPLPDDAYCDNWIGRQGLDELNRLMADGRPWFMTVNFAGPHEPLDVTARMRERWKDVPFPKPHGRPGIDDQLQQTIRQNYAAMIELIDDWLGRYQAALEEAGQLENTLLIFSSDHGEMLGDFGLWAKSVPFEGSVRVPLIMAAPGGRRAARTHDEPVALIDVAATVLDYAGCRTDGLDGVSLRPTIETGARHAREFIYSGLGSWRAVSDGRFKLVAGLWQDLFAFKIQFKPFDPNSIDDAKLFDLWEDPWEERDVSMQYPDVREKLAEAMRTDCRMSTDG